jgi:hypothetical protein
MLSLGGAGLIDDGGHPGGEALDAAAEPVAAGQVGALGGQAGPLMLQHALAAGDPGDAALQFRHVDQLGLVVVDQSAVFTAGGVEPAAQVGELGSEQLVVGCPRRNDDVGRGRGLRGPY